MVVRFYLGYYIPVVPNWQRSAGFAGRVALPFCHGHFVVANLPERANNTKIISRGQLSPPSADLFFQPTEFDEVNQCVPGLAGTYSLSSMTSSESEIQPL